MQQDRREYWAKVVAEQQSAGQTVKAFCEERGLSAYSFYVWRRRLSCRLGTVDFALIETRPAVSSETPLELIFVSGERLRIGRGVDAATLRTTLTAVRA